MSKFSSTPIPEQRICSNFSTDSYYFIRNCLDELLFNIEDVIQGKLRETVWESLYDKTIHASIQTFFGMDTCEQLSTNTRIIFFPNDAIGMINREFTIDGAIITHSWSDFSIESDKEIFCEKEKVFIVPFDEMFKKNFDWFIDSYIEWVHSEEYLYHKIDRWTPIEHKFSL